MKYFKKGVYLVVLAVMLLIAPKIGGWVADLFDYTSIDPDGSFMWISVHHIVQALIIFVVMQAMVKTTNIKFNLGLGNRSEGTKYIQRFILVFTVYTIIAFAITVATKSFVPFGYPLTVRNIFGYMGFQLLLSGPSEEFIFRAFAMSAFAYLITQRRVNQKVSYAVIFASIIFGIAHIKFSLNPFSATYSSFQVMYAIVLGYFYGDCYEKSKSVIYPMLMHSYSNVLMMGLTILLSFIL